MRYEMQVYLIQRTFYNQILDGRGVKRLCQHRVHTRRGHTQQEQSPLPLMKTNTVKGR